MCDDSAPATAVAATSDNFREAAKSAGLKLEKKLQDDSDSARKRNGFDSYEIEPYDDILMEVKQKFKDNVRSSVQWKRMTWCLTYYPRSSKGCMVAVISSGAPFASSPATPHSTEANIARHQETLGRYPCLLGVITQRVSP